MLKILPKTDHNLRTLSHSPDVFHEALRYVLTGERCFHVHNPALEDYDLAYFENDHLFLEGTHSDITFDNAVLPPYFFYDEHDSERIDLSVLDGFDTILFEEANEYTVVAASLLLKMRPMRIIFLDDRIRWFISGSEKEADGRQASGIECLPGDTDEVRALKDAPGTFLCSKDPGNNSMVTMKKNILSSEFLFHNIFLWQWLTDLPAQQVRYVSVIILKNAGIGGVLDHFMRFKRLFAKKGWETFLRPGVTRYPDRMLHQFFRFEDLPEDANDHNTIFLENMMPVRVSVAFCRSDGRLQEGMLNPDFYREISFYYDEVFRRKKVLGVLIRGTDYVSLKLDNLKRQAGPDEMIPLIDRWIREDGYEEIFLATEDADILDRMRGYYKNRLLVVSQERYRVSDFKKGEFLSDVEARKNQADQDAVVMDTVANYFYALVILSKCASFLCSGPCNGWDVVNSLNDGHFIRSEIADIR